MLLDLSPGLPSAIFLITSCAKVVVALPVGCSGSPMKTNMQEVGNVVNKIASSSVPNCCASSKITMSQLEKKSHKCGLKSRKVEARPDVRMTKPVLGQRKYRSAAKAAVYKDCFAW